MNRFISFILALVCSCGCYFASGASQVVEELVLPAVPATLLAPNDRADFIIEHFWDNLDFANDARAKNHDFMEQNFVNFLSVFPIADEGSRHTAVNTLMSKLSDDSRDYLEMMKLAEKYLFEPQSPMASDDTYELFVRNILANPGIPSEYKIRYRAHLEAIQKNRPGTVASDFTYETADGVTSSLYKTLTPNKLLLVFYDPDCDHCGEVMQQLKANDVLAKKVADNDLAVMAIYSGDEKDLWKERLPLVPEGWITGYDDGTLQDDGLYIMRMMPTLYILDSDKRVVAKDIKPETLLDSLR